jgi:hypothetical protein
MIFRTLKLIIIKIEKSMYYVNYINSFDSFGTVYIIKYSIIVLRILIFIKKM